MKLLKYIIICGILVLIVYFYLKPDLNDFASQVSINNSYSIEIPMKNTYDSLCKIEDKNNVYFPSDKVSYAILNKNDFFKRSSIIEKEKLKELLNILNDSSSYIWGELGTPEIHYYLTYFDKDDNCIGLTTLDLEGMAYSQPMTAKMKWGMIKNMSIILKLIDK